MKAIQIHKYFFIIFLLTTSTIVCTYNFDKACQNIGISNGEDSIKIVERKDSSRSYVAVLKDTKTGKRYILKQLKNKSQCFLTVVREMLGTYVVNKLGLVLSQKVIIVPAGQFEKFKGMKEQPATLHTFIAEKPLREFFWLSRLQLRQIKNHAQPKDRGLNRKIIKSMAKYCDLAEIVAIDTFLGISDRHRANLLFSTTLQRFMLIDMDYTYQNTLVQYAVNQIKKLLSKRAKLSPEECKALERYKMTLEKLRTMFSQEELNSLVEEFIKQAEVPSTTHKKKKKKTGTPNYSSIIEHIEKSMAHLDELIGLVDRLIAQKKG